MGPPPPPPPGSITHLTTPPGTERNLMRKLGPFSFQNAKMKEFVYIMLYKATKFQQNGVIEPKGKHDFKKIMAGFVKILSLLGGHQMSHEVICWTHMTTSVLLHGEEVFRRDKDTTQGHVPQH